MALISLPVLVAVGAAAVLVKALFFFFSKSSSPNPFQGPHSFQVKPKVLDQKKRDAVLKQGFSKDKIPDKLDAIVIGSGIGGMSTAAILAKVGKRVLVLEQHDQAGGCCHSFIDKGYEFDVGIHYIGEMEHPSISRTYVDHITNGQLEWTPLSESYDEVIFAEKDKDVRRYPVYSGKDKWEASLKKTFPEESANIEKFFKLVYEVQKGQKTSMIVKFIPLWSVKLLEATGLINLITNFYKWNAVTCKEVIWGLTKNQELRDIFCYCFGDYGTLPSKAGFPMQTLLHTHFMKGSSYPVGGASEIAFHIIPVIEASGGKVLVRAKVQQILVDDSGKACGVQVKKGTEPVNITAPIIISNAGLYNTFDGMLPVDIATSSRLWPMVKNSEHAIASMSVFVGLDCSAEKLDIYHKKNAWVFTKNDIDQLTKDYMKLSREEALNVDIPLLFVSFPSTKDPEWDKKYPGKTTLALVTLMPYEWLAEWENERVMKRGDDYEGIKKAFGHKAIEQTCQLFPSIRDHIDFVSIGSPLSNRFYLGSPKGEIYGLDHTRERFSIWNNALLRPKTDIPGLYLTGQDVCSCGFTGALFGGFLSASAILQRNLMKDLVALYKENKSKMSKLE